MEYFNQVTPRYLWALRYDHKRYKLKLELLSSYENVIGEIVKDISITARGQININYQQITRRSCSLTLINVDKKFTPNQNRFFWVNRKFKLWLGLQTGEDTYWFAQGVYYTQSANGDGHVVTIQGVDKGCALDGTLKLNMLETQYIVEKGSLIADMVKHTLLLNDGVNVIDPVKPIIDTSFNRTVVEADISINQCDYIGTLFSEISSEYGADVYYDINGRMNIQKLCDGDRVDGYKYMGVDYYFTDDNANYSQSSVSYNYDYVNAVTVFTNMSAKDEEGNDIENVSYTAYNRNPKSPLNINAIGIRRMEDTEIKYINGLTPEEMTERCRQYAEYLLVKNSMITMSIGFNSIIVPHLDVNKVVSITDTAKEIEDERFVLQSITIPLSAGEMSIQATSINMLASNTNMEMR